MNLLVLFDSSVDPFGTHLAFSNSIAVSSHNLGWKPLVIDVNVFGSEAYDALVSGVFDVVHLEQSHGADLVYKAISSGERVPPFFSLVRDMPFYPWIKNNIIKTVGRSKFFYVEPTAVDAARKMQPEHSAEYYPSLYTSSLISEERFVRPSDRPIDNLFVGSYQNNDRNLERLKKSEKLSSALDMVVELGTMPAHMALCQAFNREIDFSAEEDMVELCFVVNQVARSVNRERFIRKVAPKIPLTLVWNGEMPEGVRFHKDTVSFGPKAYSETVKLMHHSKTMWMMINNFGSALSERQLTSAAAGCIPFSTINGFSEEFPSLLDFFVSVDDGGVSGAVEVSKDDETLDALHEKAMESRVLKKFDPERYVDQMRIQLS